MGELEILMLEGKKCRMLPLIDIFVEKCYATLKQQNKAAILPELRFPRLSLVMAGRAREQISPLPT